MIGNAYYFFVCREECLSGEAQTIQDNCPDPTRPNIVTKENVSYTLTPEDDD